MSSRTPLNPALAVLLAVTALLSTGCDPRTPTAEGGDTPPGSPTEPPTSSSLQLEILEPAGDLAMTQGTSARIVISTLDLLATASVKIMADGDGDVATTNDQFDLATVAAKATTTPIEIPADLPANIPFGSYSILGTIDDGVRTPVHARARGRLIVDISHSLSILEPAAPVTVSRGGQLSITFVATDNDGVANLAFLADGDGNVNTTADQFPLATLTTSMQSPQTRFLDLASLPLGDYRILGIASDAGHPDVIATANGSLQVAAVAFARSEGGTDYEEGRAIAVCPDSSVVATGRFAGSSLFGEWPNFVSLNAAGDDDLFLARYSATGSMLWAVPAGGPSRGDWGNSVAAFADGSILLGGYFHGLASFNGGPLAGGVLSAGDDDAFVARYGANGALTWVRRAGGVFHDEVTGVATCPDGDFVATGQFAAQGTFGEGAATRTLLVAGSLLTSDGFVARYRGDGTLVWVKQFGGAAGNDQGTSIAAGADGSCVVTGTFAGTATFGEGSNQVTLTSAGGTDVFVARYDAAGALSWARRGGGSSDDAARGVTMLPNGACVACGAYAGIATFGDPASPEALQALGARDAYLARFEANGALTWIRSAGGTNEDEARGVAASGDGGCVVTGSFHTFATFGQAPTQRNIAAVGLRDVFVARYDGSGALLWVKRAGGTNHDLGYGIAAFADGSCAVTGTFQGDTTFGAGPAATTVSANGLGDVFIARFNADGNF